jgi:outer membrane protein OmpA-like peptidoglycan-associated protein
MRYRPRHSLVVRVIPVSCRSLTLLSLLLAAPAFAPRPAAAADRLSLELRGDLGVGSMISRTQRTLGYGSTFVPELHPGLRFTDHLVAELAFASWFFPVNDDSGRATLLGAGLRLDDRVLRKLTLYVDGHAGLGLTGPNNRLMFDGGGGLEYTFTPFMAVGPFARYGQIVASGTDPKFIAGGVRLALFWPQEGPPSAPRRTIVSAPASTPAPRREAPVAATAPPRLADSDNDGVRDGDDACPSEPKGPTPDPQRPGCPDGDDDKDGITNGLDQCRNQHFGFYADPLALGCPLADRDRDSVPDLYDACPDEPGGPDPQPRKNGCPGLVRLVRGELKIEKPIAFSGKDLIASSSFPVLRAVAGALKATPAIKKLSIEGHTDGQGDPEQNLELSRQRAESVRRWLSENGIEGVRLEAKGFGDSRPIASNKTSKGRAENRRIELVIVDPQLDPGPLP